MRSLNLIICSLLAIAGAWWLFENEHTRNLIAQYIENGEFTTLEARYSAEQIMEQRRNELIGNTSRTYYSTELKFHPYILMDVKYALPDRKTREGVILWSLVDGEMVLNTDTWEKTHGFEDTINGDANPEDFKILNALAKNNGKLSRDQLQKILNMDHDTIEPWLASVKQKHLVLLNGNEVQLHFQNPKISVTPQTKITQWLVTKPYNHAQKVSKKYAPDQVKKIAKAAFGAEFTIRHVQEVFLPVYRIDVANPDGSILTSYWNALNGQRIAPNYLN